MSSAYGSLAPSSASAVPLPLPVNSVLKNGTRVSLVQVTPEMLSNGATLARLQALLNHEIECGNTYPQEFSLDEDSFKVGLIVYWLTNNSNLEAYFLSAAAFMLKTHDNHIVGSFYIKPNYPGRCSHICNGGFITASEWRGQGVGKIMGKAFIQLAPLLGYKASVFNLVFESNIPSVNLWRSLGFSEIGRVPKAGRLKGSDKLVDAIVFHYDFES